LQGLIRVTRVSSWVPDEGGAIAEPNVKWLMGRALLSEEAFGPLAENHHPARNGPLENLNENTKVFACNGRTQICHT
jgi:hypothetical protein